MSKIIDGIELLEMIKDGKIPYRTKINIVSDNETLKFYTIYGKYRQLHLIRDDNGKIEDIRCIDTEDLLTHKFEIEEQEEQEEIDIQDIKELDFSASPLAKTNLLNELVQTVKQLDKQLHKTEKEQ